MLAVSGSDSGMAGPRNGNFNRPLCCRKTAQLRGLLIMSDPIQAIRAGTHVVGGIRAGTHVGGTRARTHVGGWWIHVACAIMDEALLSIVYPPPNSRRFLL